MSKFKKIFKIAAPIAAGFIPGIGPLAAAALGAGLGAMGGGGLKGALLGGLGSYVGGGGTFGSAAGSLGSRIGGALGTGGAQTINRALGGAISGASQGGKGALTGALLGGLGANAGDIGSYVGRQFDSLGQGVDSTLGTNIFRDDPTKFSTDLAGAAKAQLGLVPEYPEGTNENWLMNYQYNTPGSAAYGQAPSGTQGGQESGTSTDAGGAGTGAKEMKFSDVLSGVNDYYAQDKMQEEQMDALKRAEAAYSPYLSAGGQGLNELLRGYNPGDLTQDPSYQFRLQEGQKALERSMAARGMLGSGQAMKAITDYGQNMAATAYDDAYRNWMQRNLALAQYGNQNLGGMANIYQQMGDVSASSPLSNNSFINAVLSGQYGGF